MSGKSECCCEYNPLCRLRCDRRQRYACIIDTVYSVVGRVVCERHCKCKKQCEVHDTQFPRTLGSKRKFVIGVE